jgi:hypothetical protein
MTRKIVELKYPAINKRFTVQGSRFRANCIQLSEFYVF